MVTNTADNWLLQAEATAEVISLDCRFPQISVSFDDYDLRPHDSVEVKVYSYNSGTYWWMPGTASVPFAMSGSSVAVRHLLFDKDRQEYIPGADPPPRPVSRIQNGYSSSTGYQMMLGSCLAILCFKNDYKDDPLCMSFFKLLYNLRIPIIPMRMKAEDQWDPSAVACFGMAPQLNYIDLPKKILSGVNFNKGPMPGSRPPPPELGDMSLVVTSRVPPTTDIRVAEPGSVVEVCMPVKVGNRWEPSFPLRLLDKASSVFISYAWKTSKLAQRDIAKSSDIHSNLDESACGRVDPREIHKWMKQTEKIGAFMDYDIFKGGNDAASVADNEEFCKRTIAGSRLFVCCLSASYLESTACMKELQVAIEQKVTIIFLLVGVSNHANGQLADLEKKIAKEQWPQHEVVDARKYGLEDTKNNLKAVLTRLSLVNLRSVTMSETESVTSSHKTYNTSIGAPEFREKDKPPKDPFAESEASKKHITFWAWIPVVLSQRSADGNHCKVIGMGTKDPNLSSWSVETVADMNGDVWVRQSALRPFQEPFPDLSSLKVGDRVEVRVSGVLMIKEFKVGGELFNWRIKNPRTEVANFPRIAEISEVAKADQAGNVYDAWKFVKDEVWGGVELLEDGMMVKFEGPDDGSATVVQSKLPLWFTGNTSDLKFKIEVVKLPKGSRIAIGMAPKPYPPFVMPCQEDVSPFALCTRFPTPLDDEYGECNDDKSANEFTELNGRKEISWDVLIRTVTFTHKKRTETVERKALDDIMNRSFHISISCIGSGCVRLLQSD
ncbi:hypothetical protein BC829DRAFT_442205 [Chytridium lagenaria]|nr:hypothetical protein BC829DRAFT_442205 [Chytridium lagenaria]